MDRYDSIRHEQRKIRLAQQFKKIEEQIDTLVFYAEWSIEGHRPGMTKLSPEAKNIELLKTERLLKRMVRDVAEDCGFFPEYVPGGYCIDQARKEQKLKTDMEEHLKEMANEDDEEDTTENG